MGLHLLLRGLVYGVFLPNLCSISSAVPQGGKFHGVLRKGSESIFLTNLYENASVKITVTKKRECDPRDGILHLKWVMRRSACKAEYTEVLKKSFSLIDYPDWSRNGTEGDYMRNGNNGDYIECNSDYISLADFTNSSVHPWLAYPHRRKRFVFNRRKRNVVGNTQDTEKVPRAQVDDSEVDVKSSVIKDHNPQQTGGGVVTVAPYTGAYIIVIRLEGKGDFEYDIVVDMKSPSGYLSASDYPLLHFRMAMCLAFAGIALAWCLSCMRNRKQLQTVHHYISAVIVICIIDQALLFIQYHIVNESGENSPGAEICVQVISIVKTISCRMLFLLLACGLGIAISHPGKKTVRAMILLSIFYAVIIVVHIFIQKRNISPTAANSSTMLLVHIALFAILDIILCVWIIYAMVNTMRTVRERNDSSKVVAMRSYAYVLFLGVTTRTLLGVWSLAQTACEKDWRDWFSEADSDILLFMFIGAIMLLWRPTAYNRSNALKPIIEGGTMSVINTNETLTMDELSGRSNKREDKTPLTMADDLSDEFDE